MEKKTSVPAWAWAYYQAYQKKAANGSNAADEQVLDYLVERFRRGKIPETIEDLERLVDNHLAGNRTKNRRRGELLEKWRCSEEGDKPTDQLLSRDLLEAVRQSASPLDWQLLTALAIGYDYRELSNALHIPVGTLKSTVCRFRSHFQNLAPDDSGDCHFESARPPGTR